MRSNLKRLELLEKNLKIHAPIVELIFLNEGEDQELALLEARRRNPMATDFTFVIFVSPRHENYESTLIA
jgi:hypothetical protein